MRYHLIHDNRIHHREKQKTAENDNGGYQVFYAILLVSDDSFLVEI